MRFQPVDHVPDMEFGYWSDTLIAWRAQGMPAQITDDGKADRFFGFAPMGGVPVHHGIIPSFEPQVLEETGSHRIEIDGEGTKMMVHTDGASSIPKYLEFPVKDAKSWDTFKERLDPDDPRRFPKEEDWQQMKARWAQRDYPLSISIGSLLGVPRNWMGFEGIAMAVHDDPGLVQDIVDTIVEVVARTIERPLREVDIDLGAGWEDICFNKGPLMSPAQFRRFCVPGYKRITDLCRAHGVDLFYTDCDGNINELIDPWLEGGLNAIFPVEVAGGTDPIAIRRKYGDKIAIVGGVNKRALIAGKDAIEAEIERIAPYVKEGGWIPHVDHRVPPDVTYENYLYYLRRKRETFDIPEPPEWSGGARRTIKRTCEPVE